MGSLIKLPVLLLATYLSVGDGRGATPKKGVQIDLSGHHTVNTPSSDGRDGAIPGTVSHFASNMTETEADERAWVLSGGAGQRPGSDA